MEFDCWKNDNPVLQLALPICSGNLPEQVDVPNSTWPIIERLTICIRKLFLTFCPEAAQKN